MRDILVTLASVPPDSGLLRRRSGEWESFVDARGGVAIEFAHAGGCLVARVVGAPGVCIDGGVTIAHADLPALRALLRRAADPGRGPRVSN